MPEAKVFGKLRGMSARPVDEESLGLEGCIYYFHHRGDVAFVGFAKGDTCG
jgi:hypothetical protein